MEENIFVGGIFLRYLLLNWMETGIGYRIVGKTYDNLGLHASLLFGQLQWRVDIYNVPGIFGLGSRYGGLGMGISYNY